MSDRSVTLAELREIASRTFRCDPAAIQEGTSATDIEKWDSLRHLVFIGNVEQKFACEFDMERIARLTNIGDLIDAIEEIK